MTACRIVQALALTLSAASAAITQAQPAPDDVKMDLKAGVDDAVARLSRNPKGFVLVVFSDCHTGKAGSSLSRIVELDNIARELAAAHKQDTLLLWTADHSYDLHINLGQSAARSSHPDQPHQDAADNAAIAAASATFSQTSAVVNTGATGSGTRRRIQFGLRFEY